MSDAPPHPEPFAPQTAPAALEDLRARLRATRWPDAPRRPSGRSGPTSPTCASSSPIGRTGFDWPAQEAARGPVPPLPRPPRWPRDPLRARPGRRSGWASPAVGPQPRLAGFVLALRQVIPLLTDPGAHGADPADAFDVVVPDMPGFGYSDRPAGPPPDSIAVAGLWAELMGVLGYARFGAAGGDIGSHVSRYLALDHADRVVAVHRMDAGLPVFTGDPADLAPEERAWFEGVAAWGATEGAYAAMHRTKPQTAAFGLTDSRPGSRRGSWRSSGRGATAAARSNGASPRTRSSRTVTLYWLTGTIGSSDAHVPRERPRSRPRSLPAGSRCRRVSRSLPATSSAHPERGSSVRRTSYVLPKPACGGHFAPFEEPELYAEELRAFFRPYRAVATG